MRKYSGLSKRGSVDEAIADAIANAKDGIKTDYVEWKLLEVSGKNGGFVLLNELSVTIDITAP